MGGGSDDEVATMINDHYKGLLDIAEYWQIGDIRSASITAIASGTTGESQSAQDIQLVIIGINHDDLADGSGKAIVTVQTVNNLGTVGYINENRDSPSYSLWSTSQRRTWCNGDFKSALPTWIQSLIKPVSKITNRHGYYQLGFDNYRSYRGQTTTKDDTFLLSEFEIFGSAPYSGDTYGDVGSDGTQYDYMKTQANRVKSGPAANWWSRSSEVASGGYSNFIVVMSGGTANHGNASSNIGIAPAFCL